MNSQQQERSLFRGCWIALVTTSFGFIARIFTQGAWGAELNLSNTQVGEILGVGLWPFSISIVLFSLIMDKIGYKTAMIFGFACHVLSVVLTLTAHSYSSLYWATFIMALGNGTVEAYINPIVATMFSKDKPRWLNYLHGGWSGGFVIAGLVLIIALPDAGWRTKILIVLIPAIIYFLMLIGKKFPVGESAAAGVSFRETLGEVGGLGFFLITWLMAAEFLRSSGLVVATDASPYAPLQVGAIIAAVVGVGVGYYTKSYFGRPIFLILLLLMMLPLSTTELGVDSWITDLMTPTMGEKAKWLFVYTSAVMTAMRFCSGPILRALTPLGVLAVAAGGAAIALFGLSGASTAAAIFLFGTLYGAAKAFFWPTTLAVVSEQYPRGGAMTLNGISGTGLLGVGVLGAMFLGGIVDKTTDVNLQAADAAIHAKVTIQKSSLLGMYYAIDQTRYEALTAPEKAVVDTVKGGAKKGALKFAAYLPLIMLATYLLLLLYFRSIGGYKPVDIAASTTNKSGGS
jgi:MFS family permease